jgi:hypothetical protein
MNVNELRRVFSYDPRTGALLQNGYPIASQVVKLPGPGYPKSVNYASLCYWLHYGYAPRRVRFRNGNSLDTRVENIYELYAYKLPKHLAPAVAYPGVFPLRDGTGYQGSTYRRGRRHCTAVVETPEEARDLRQQLREWLEWVESQKGTAQ